jgi:hypothetical protein
MSTAAERQQFLAYLKGHGHRVTSERLEVFEEIYAQHGHIDAEKLLGSLRERGAKVSRATVYRNLDLMVGCGLVRKSNLGQGGTSTSTCTPARTTTTWSASPAAGSSSSSAPGSPRSRPRSAAPTGSSAAGTRCRSRGCATAARPAGGAERGRDQGRRPRWRHDIGIRHAPEGITWGS